MKHILKYLNTILFVAYITTSDMHGLKNTKDNEKLQDWFSYTGWRPRPDQAPDNRTEEQLDKRLERNAKRIRIDASTNKPNCDELNTAILFAQYIAQDAQKSGLDDQMRAAKEQIKTATALLQQHCAADGQAEDAAQDEAEDQDETEDYGLGAPKNINTADKSELAKTIQEALEELSINTLNDLLLDNTLLNKQYRKLSLERHPDKNKQSGSAEAMKNLNNAKDLLQNVLEATKALSTTEKRNISLEKAAELVKAFLELKASEDYKKKHLSIMLEKALENLNTSKALPNNTKDEIIAKIKELTKALNLFNTIKTNSETLQDQSFVNTANDYIHEINAMIATLQNDDNFTGLPSAQNSDDDSSAEDSFTEFKKTNLYEQFEELSKSILRDEKLPENSDQEIAYKREKLQSYLKKLKTLQNTVVRSGYDQSINDFFTNAYKELQDLINSLPETDSSYQPHPSPHVPRPAGARPQDDQSPRDSNNEQLARYALNLAYLAKQKHDH